MKIVYDAQVDALSITFRETTVTTKHVAEGIALDYDSEGQLAGIEVLDAVRRFGGRETLRQVVMEGVGLATTN
jgi:uncharacterized protein YuzE